MRNETLDNGDEKSTMLALDLQREWTSYPQNWNQNQWNTIWEKKCTEMRKRITYQWEKERVVMNRKKNLPVERDRDCRVSEITFASDVKLE